MANCDYLIVGFNEPITIFTFCIHFSQQPYLNYQSDIKRAATPVTKHEILPSSILLVSRFVPANATKRLVRLDILEINV